MEIKKFETVKEVAEWLNEKEVYRQNFEEIVGNYDLKVVGMN